MRNLLALSIVLSLGAPAFAGQVSVQLAGDSFEGPAAFELALDGKAIASAELDPASPPDVPKTYRFDVPDDSLRAGREFSVRLTNDRYVAGQGDRNLYLFGAKVGDRSLAAGDFQVQEDGRPQDRPAGPSVGLLSDNQRAVAVAPEGGWLPAANQADCTAELQITGYAVNIFDLDQDQKTKLTAFLATVPDASCALSITGYASGSGRKEINDKISQQRAEKVGDFVRESAAKFASQRIVAAGATTQFGTRDQDNRRVVVKLGE